MAGQTLRMGKVGGYLVVEQSETNSNLAFRDQERALFDPDTHYRHKSNESLRVPGTELY